MSRPPVIFRLVHHERGTSVTEFVVIAPLFFALFFGILEFGLAFYWAKGLEKAAQLGARLAVVSDPLVALPAINTQSGANAVFGQLCRDASNPCTDFGQLVYTCAPACASNPIIDQMRAIFPPVEDGTITIAYQYVRLGFAGGPPVPSITVTISGVPPPFGALNVVFPIFFGGAQGSATLPNIRATLTGEDLDT